MTGESPARYRAFGVWSPAQTAQTANEVWSVSYEGALPNTAGAGGRFVDETTFYAPAIRFCDAGVNGAMNGDVEDLISVDVHREQVPSDLRIELGLETSEGVACPVEASEHLTIDFPILEVGDTSVRVDTSRARIRPHPPELGEIEVNETQLNLANECQEAFDRMDLAAYELETEVTPRHAPARHDFCRETLDSWLIEGSCTGFVHANKWNPETGTCDAVEKT